ncbi:MAG: hypothetical protein H7Y05_01590 [Steroidobacteraceae bacterium]|nr:hypothetical protein [Deltaproteobacteria bacterium]
MSEIMLFEQNDQSDNNRCFQKALDYCKKWSDEHQAEVGVAEMAIGASLLSWGILDGHILMGQDVVGSMLPDIGGFAGLGLGTVGTSVIAATFLKSIFVGGVTGIAGVTAIPALALIGGGTLIFGSFGYVIGDAVKRFVTPDFGDLFLDASIVTVGTALMIDGARRLVKDERVLQAASDFKDGVIHLVETSTEVVAITWDELQSKIQELANHPDAKNVAISTTTGTTAVVAGTTIGGTLAAGSVTILGSHGLGAVALSLGLVSAPVWPIVAGGAAGLAIGLATWKGVQHYRNKQSNDTAKEELQKVITCRQETL